MAGVCCGQFPISYYSVCTVEWAWPEVEQGEGERIVLSEVLPPDTWTVLLVLFARHHTLGVLGLLECLGMTEALPTYAHQVMDSRLWIDSHTKLKTSNTQSGTCWVIGVKGHGRLASHYCSHSFAHLALKWLFCNWMGWHPFMIGLLYMNFRWTSLQWGQDWNGDGIGMRLENGNGLGLGWGWERKWEWEWEWGWGWSWGWGGNVDTCREVGQCGKGIVFGWEWMWGGDGWDCWNVKGDSALEPQYAWILV